MLLVTINKLQFEYDIYSLVKAFFPEEEIKVLLEGSEELERFQNEGRTLFSICFKESSYQLFKEAAIIEEVVVLETEKRIEKKNKLKQMIYKELASITNKDLPWGTLTGIRPTKIPMLMLEEGLSSFEVKAQMKHSYLMSEEKAELVVAIAEREKELLADIHYKNGYSLYIGIPFCPTTCLYCSFTSYPIGLYKKQVKDYLDTLEKEIEFVAAEYSHKILDTVYIGGGTPTTLEPEELERLLFKVKTTFDFSKVKEFTVEAGRADSITEEKLKILKKYGVDRISVNPQTMKADTLKLIGRKGTPEQVKEAFWLARKLGFENINMDLILGLPEETEEDVKRTMEEIEKLKPDSVTVHSLAVKRASNLHEWIIKNGISLLKNTTETMEITRKSAESMDMLPYYLYRQKNMSGNFENVGYATKGNFGIYNILIMEEKQPIIAVGAGSISKVILEDGRIKRCDCIKDVGLYIERIDEMIERKRKLFAAERGEEYGVK